MEETRKKEIYPLLILPQQNCTFQTNFNQNNNMFINLNIFHTDPQDVRNIIYSGWCFVKIVDQIDPVNPETDNLIPSVETTQSNILANAMQYPLTDNTHHNFVANEVHAVNLQHNTAANAVQEIYHTVPTSSGLKFPISEFKQNYENAAIKQLMSPELQGNKPQKIIYFKPERQNIGHIVRNLPRRSGGRGPLNFTAYHCPSCSLYFTKYVDCKKHIQVHIMPQHSTINTENNFVCKLCGKRLETQEQWQLHCHQHGNLRKCGECKKMFTSDFSLINHLKTHKKSKQTKRY